MRILHMIICYDFKLNKVELASISLEEVSI
jgi:hypothetical protein